MKIVVLDSSTLGNDISLDVLSTHGDVIEYKSTDSTQLPHRCAEADVLVLNKVKINEAVFAAAPNLKLICVTATGYDNIDLCAARKHGVAVANVPGYSTDSVALFTVATVLSLVTHLREYNEYVTSGEYTRSGIANRLFPVYHEIRGLTWGIIGYGNIGRAVADVARALGARVIVNKRTPVEDAECVALESLVEQSDIITVHCPLNEGTKNIINAESISKMKKNVIIVNEARGGVVNSEDVARAIEEGRIGGFGSDVYSPEPFGTEHPFTRIMNFKNILLTPHAAWGAYESRKRCLDIVSENIRSFFVGKILNRLDKTEQ